MDDHRYTEAEHCGQRDHQRLRSGVRVSENVENTDLGAAGVKRYKEKADQNNSTGKKHVPPVAAIK